MTSATVARILRDQIRQGSNDPRMTIAAEDRRLRFTGRKWISWSGPAAFDLYDLGRAVVESGESLWPKAPDSPEEFIAVYGLDAVVAQVTQLVEAEFGSRAYVRPVLKCDPETGEPSLVLEAHYRFAGAADDLLVRHNRLMDRYVEEVPFDTPVGHVLTWVPDDGD